MKRGRHSHDVIPPTREKSLTQRLTDLREHDVLLENAVTGERETTPVKTVAALAPEDEYELGMVVMRKNHALDILPVLTANKRVSTMLFR